MAAAAGAALLAILIYAPGLRFEFVRDDHDLVERNPTLRPPLQLAPLVTADFWHAAGKQSGMWRPLVTLSYAWDAARGSVRPEAFHVTNVALHAAASACVAGLAQQAGATWWVGLLAGGWFAAAPAHVESVAWISGRPDLVCGLAFALALMLERRARRQARNGPRILAVAAFAASLLGKETALSGLAVLAVAQAVETPPSRSGLARALRGLMPYLIVALAWGFVHRQLGGELRLASWIDATTGRVQGWDAVAAVPRAALALLPGVTHVPDRMAAPGALGARVGLVVGFAAWLIAGAGLALALRRRSELAVALALVTFPLLVLAAAAASTGYATIAERNLYLPSIGVGLALAWGLTRLAGSGRPAWRTAIAAVAGSALVIVSTGESRAALASWRNDRALYETMVRAEPRNVPAQIGLAHALLRDGDEAAANEHLRMAQAFEPRNPAIPLTFAVTAARRGDWAGELAAARQALGFDSLRVDGAGHEASALIHLGRDAEAESLLASRMSRGAGPPALLALRGTALVHLKRFPEARPLLESAAATNPNDPGLLLMLGECYGEMGEIMAACAAYERATALAPESYGGWLRLAEARSAAGDRAGALAALASAARLPDAADGRVARVRAALDARGTPAVPARPAPRAP